MVNASETSPAHTRNPWEHEYSGFTSSWLIRERDTGNCIAESKYLVGADAIEDERESFANARLIAAAPDLLDGCNYALAVLESMPEAMREELADILDEDIEFDRLRFPLEKANGKTA